jgi:hypothetical protein
VGGSFLLQAAEGITFLWRTVAIRLVFLSFFAIVFFNAVDDVALVFLGRQSLHAGNAGVSLLYAGSAAGLIAGYAAVNRWGASAAAPALLVTGYAVGSLGNLFTSVSWAITAALAFQAIRGLGLAAQDAAAAAMIQRAIPRAAGPRILQLLRSHRPCRRPVLRAGRRAPARRRPPRHLRRRRPGRRAHRDRGRHPASLTPPAQPAGTAPGGTAPGGTGPGGTELLPRD